MSQNNLTSFYILRHGETVLNTLRILQGQFDSPLTENGIRQAEEAARKFSAINFDAIFSSDLLRAKRTAEIIKLDRSLEIMTRKALRERTWGKYDGKLASEFVRETKELLIRYQQLSEKEKWRFKFDEESESDEEVVSRFITLLREIAVGFPGKTILVVTHGGNIITFLGHLGYIKTEEIRSTKFVNTGYLKLTSDGVDFFLHEVIGCEKNKFPLT